MADASSRRPTPRRRGEKPPRSEKPARGGRTARRARPTGRSGAAPGARSKTRGAASRVPSGSRGSTPAFLARRPSSGAAPRPAERRQRHQRAQVLRVAVVVLGALAALAVVAAVALFALRDAPVFKINQIEFEPTEHISAEDVQNLARVPEGSTLLNVDTSAIEESLRRNPWVGSVSFVREFPGTLRVVIQEQRPDMLVVMASGSMAWYLGDAGTWIEPVPLQTAEGQSVDDAALAVAQESGCLLVTDVPPSVDPEAGSAATDEVLTAVQQFREGFSSDFSDQVVSYGAPSAENISCVLKSGVEVSLGSPDSISEKEQIVEAYLDQYPGHVVRINVRVPSDPTFREIDSDSVEAGDGVSVGEDASGSASDGAS